MATALKITKPTFNVLTEGSAKNFIFDSSLNHLKTAGSGIISKTVGAGGILSQSVAHGLAVKPMVVGYWRDTADTKWYITMSQPITATLSRQVTDLNVSHTVDATNIVFYFHNDNGSSHTIQLKYEFLYEGS